MKDSINVYMREPKVTVLGPGERYVLWVQGCDKECPGCIAANAHNKESGTEISIDALAYEIALSHTEGITISGGEPFLQAEELTALLVRIKKIRDMGVIVYTGYLYNELLENESARSFLSMIDLLIDGPYISDLDDGMSLRGSSNQHLVFLTERYKSYENEYGVHGRKKEVFHHGISVHEVGIPSNI